MAVSPVDAGSLVGERLGKYQLLALIAIGGTAEIYLARIGGEAGFEKYVVVKCLLDHLADDTDFVRMFLDEARLCAQLDHSNIVQTLELGQHEGRYYMVMEHLAGMSLAQLARKTHERVPEGVIPTRIVLGLAAQACAGLHYAHQRTGNDGNQLNVVHRDVSPQNLVVTFEGMLKIVDFGIAKADLRQTHTRSGTIKGKFAYMSPEQCLAEPIDRRTDVFALGTVVHELLTARRLFKRASTYETYQAILKGNAPPPSRYNTSVDEELDRVVLRALAYDKDDRFESTEAFGEAMLGWLHSRGQSISATDVSRYVEKVCAVEIEEHAAHMRELISGHRLRSGESLRWDVAAEEAESLSLGASPLSSDSALRFDIGSGDDDGDSSQIEERSDPGPGDESGDFGGDFGGDTQIELDPLARVAALEAEAEAAAAAAAFRVPQPLRGAASHPGAAPAARPARSAPPPGVKARGPAAAAARGAAGASGGTGGLGRLAASGVVGGAAGEGRPARRRPPLQAPPESGPAGTSSGGPSGGSSRGPAGSQGGPPAEPSSRSTQDRGPALFAGSAGAGSPAASPVPGRAAGPGGPGASGPSAPGSAPGPRGPGVAGEWSGSASGANRGVGGERSGAGSSQPGPGGGEWSGAGSGQAGAVGGEWSGPDSGATRVAGDRSGPGSGGAGGAGGPGEARPGGRSATPPRTPSASSGTAVGRPTDEAPFASTLLRPRTADGGLASGPPNGPAGARRSANEQTAPEMEPGRRPAHDQLTMPAGDLVADPDAATGPSPIGGHASRGTPGAPVGMWSDDSAEVLRSGRPPSHGPHPAGPGAPLPDARGSEQPPHLRATMLRPPPGLPGPGLGPNLGPGPSAPRMSVWVLALAFVLSAGLGLGLTVLIGSLLV